jgi:hypothetical protein
MLATVIPGRTPEHTVNILAKRLSPTEEQKAKMLPIIELGRAQRESSS